MAADKAYKEKSLSVATVDINLTQGSGLPVLKRVMPSPPKDWIQLGNEDVNCNSYVPTAGFTPW